MFRRGKFVAWTLLDSCVQRQKTAPGVDLAGLQQPKINRGVFSAQGGHEAKQKGRGVFLSQPRHCCMFNMGHAKQEISPVFSGVSGESILQAKTKT